MSLYKCKYNKYIYIYTHSPESFLTFTPHHVAQKAGAFFLIIPSKTKIQT